MKTYMLDLPLALLFTLLLEEQCVWMIASGYDHGRESASSDNSRVIHDVLRIILFIVLTKVTLELTYWRMSKGLDSEVCCQRPKVELKTPS